MKALSKNIRISSKKANLVASFVRNKKVDEALNLLKFTPKKAAPIIAKAIKSAANNATNNFKQNFEDLYIKEIYVNEGTTLKRRRLISRGRAHPILKRTSHVKVFLEIRTNDKIDQKIEKEVKTEKKEKTQKKSTK
ncbi:MAG: 50S ribosomal protein L22 [Candidatus Peregrinibacteria bacterium GW2011_GWA2_33_10]|nr:MAG: 50S ribosomal protein L22 [Candidatus Peregrinibacteria bacterium GW2011_GWA2_33_10]KKP40750.1 MAG: 50S ribosomal protein L22, large subunit ribosomal protein L22 [Candidatus Peregrinibacteria bacterium GW2011_GWC2_33_13]OGJ51108.1 MAG: 50S ribosomal protein L22 [Candidatus Peregrinibacteria bacterium RIFOXYA2_FULL_33_7]